MRFYGRAPTFTSIEVLIPDSRITLVPLVLPFAIDVIRNLGGLSLGYDYSGVLSSPPTFSV